MADTTINNVQPTTSSQYEGVSNPPDNGRVLLDTALDVPNSDESTVPQSAAPNQPPPQTPPQTPNTGTTPPQSVQGPQPQGQPTQQQPDLSKPPQGVQPTAAPTTAPVPPVVQKASIFHDIAETLAGGPRYTYSVDAYGNMQRQQVPVSNAHIALAIAMEALGGAAEGFGAGGGPNAAGKAAAAGYKAGFAQRQNQEQMAKNEASADFARRAQVMETNMRMLSSARALGKQDADTIDSYISQYKDLVNKLQTEYPGYIKGIAKYSDLAKYNATVDTAIPYMRVPRLDPKTQKQVEVNGVPQWDMDYMVLDPSFKAAGLLSPEALKTLKRWGQPWADNPNVPNTPLNASLALNKASQAAHLSVAESTLNNYWDTLNKAHENPTASQGFTLDRLNTLVDENAKKAGVSPDLIKAVIEQESGGDPNAVSPTGATGLMQLTGSTARQYNVTDRTNPEQNVQAGTQLFSELLNRFKDPRLAYAAYYSGPGAIQNGQIVDTKDHTAADTAKQADHFMQIVQNGPKFGKIPQVTNPQEVKEAAENHMSIDDFVKSDPSAASDMEKFMGALNGTGGKYGAAMQHLIASGQSDAAGRISALLGGPDNITKHDNYVTAQQDAQKAAIQTEAINERAEQAAQRKTANDEAAYQKTQDKLNSLMQADIPLGIRDMPPRDMVQTLQAKGVTIDPSALIDAQTIANYDAPMSTASNKIWYKDMHLNQGDLLSIVKQFNPDYSASNYENLRTFKNPNSRAQTTIQAASGIANHLNLLLQAAKEVSTNGEGSGQFPALNKLANIYNYHKGGTAYSTLSALTNAVNGEMGKTLSGGFAPDKEQVQALMENMRPENSLAQIQKLGAMYTEIMHGKVLPLDEQYNNLSNGRHMPVPPSLTNLFKSYNLDTPWSEQPTNAQGQQQAVPQGFNAMTKDGKLVLTPQGQWIENPELIQSNRSSNLVNTLRNQ